MEIFILAQAWNFPKPLFIVVTVFHMESSSQLKRFKLHLTLDKLRQDKADAVARASADEGFAKRAAAKKAAAKAKPMTPSSSCSSSSSQGETDDDEHEKLCVDCGINCVQYTTLSVRRDNVEIVACDKCCAKRTSSTSSSSNKRKAWCKDWRRLAVVSCSILQDCRDVIAAQKQWENKTK